jgi:hypothetical protein
MVKFKRFPTPIVTPGRVVTEPKIAHVTVPVPPLLNKGMLCTEGKLEGSKF